MFTIYGKNYYIDIESITDLCAIQNNNEDENLDEFTPTTSVDIFKYDIVKICIDRIMNPTENDLESSGLFSEPSFTLSFNTLLKYKIIKEEEEKD